MLQAAAYGAVVAGALGLCALGFWLEVRRAYRAGWVAGRAAGSAQAYQDGVQHGYRRGLADRYVPPAEPVVPAPPRSSVDVLGPTLPSPGERQTFRACKADLLAVAHDARKAAESYPDIGHDDTTAKNLMAIQSMR